MRGQLRLCDVDSLVGSFESAVDDITDMMKRKKKEVAEMAKHVIKKLSEEVKKKASICQSLKMIRKERAR